MGARGLALHVTGAAAAAAVIVATTGHTSSTYLGEASGDRDARQ